MKPSAQGDAVSCLVEKAVLHYWVGESMPVVLVKYDVRKEIARWLHSGARVGRRYEPVPQLSRRLQSRLMDEITDHSDVPLCAKIARLVKERGWNQEAFARQAELNRLTVRSIFLGPARKLHNATVCACARALGLSVNDLLTQPLDRLLPKMRVPLPARESLRILYEQATQPELLAWLQGHPERAAELTVEEIDELLSLQGTGGPLTEFGVAHYVEQIERRRKILEQAAVIAGTEYIDLLEQFVGLLYEKIQPYRDRK